MKVLWATKKEAPNWDEQIITTKEDHIEAASAWAIDNGFINLRIQVIDDNEKPDFIGTIQS